MNKLIVSAAMALCVCAASATETGTPPLWLRKPALSPDGKTLAFTYKGDIYTVASPGGRARQLTTDSNYDTDPVWSPDGSRLAFASDRHGSLDIFVIPADGGTARRLTTHSGTEHPLTWLNDSIVLFSATQMGSPKAIVPAAVAQTYTVNANRPGRPHLYAHVAMPSADADKTGRIVYQDRKGFEDVRRKHEHSSGTTDIWIKDGNNFWKVTSFIGQDQSPVWVDENTIAYISETDGTMNVWQSAIDGSSPRQLTSFKNHPVRDLTRSDAGLMAFSWDGELYTLNPGGRPQQVDITIVTDDYDADLQKSLRTSGATNMSVSPDGNEVAFVLRGDVYVTSTKYKTTRRITDTPAQERWISFSPDGRTLVYDSERDGLWQLFTASPANPDEKSLLRATDIVEKPLYADADGRPAQQPEYSPDGKKIAFLRGRTELCVIDPGTKGVSTALDGKYNYSYSDGDIAYTWSPDSRWFLIDYIGNGGWNNTDIALVKADGSEVVDLTESGYSDSMPRWALGGRAFTYQTGRYGMKSHGSWGEQDDIVIMALDGDAWDELNLTEEEAALAKEAADKNKKDSDAADKSSDKKKKDSGAAKKDEVKPLVFDLDNRHYRTRRITGTSASMGDYWLNKDGDKLYYVAANADGKRNLMVRDLRKGDTKVLVAGLSGGFMPDAKGENLFGNGSGGMFKVSLPDGKKESIDFEAEYNRHPSQERKYIYEHMLSQVNDKFYDKNLHGVDWKMYGDAYRRFLPHINNNYDFADLLSEILGELNASHTGGSYRPGGRGMSVASLGAFFDEEYDGAGLRVREVLPRGPLADKKAGISAGDIILAIDGNEIAPGADFNPLLEGKAGKPILLTVLHADGSVNNVSVKPLYSSADLLYQRWVERNERIVDSISGGRIAYVHIEGMNSPSFRTVYSKLLGKYRNHDAVVVDTRWNGGGWLHNDVALLLSGKEYVRYSPRGQYIGSDPFSQWTKPSAMLVNESNYSDAHGTPYVYQTLKIGDVVGAPVPGTMTAVWWETQIDPTLVFGIPEVTSLDRNGRPLENQQLNPDVIIYNNPADVLNGHDSQLEAAVRNLLNRLNK